jgi:DNA polymerase III epsilon subunit-like protein
MKVNNSTCDRGVRGVYPSKIIIFDTETTGLPKSRQSLVNNTEEWPYIVQFSYIIYDLTTNQIEVVSDHIIKLEEDIDIPEESSKIHGITKEISNEKGVSIKEVIDRFIVDLSDCELLIAHNLEFDLNVLIVELIRMNRYAELLEDDVSIDLNNTAYKKITNIEKYCTMKETEKKCNIKAVSKTGKEYTKYPTLGELHYYLFKSYPKNLHNSLNDILICLRCFYMLQKKEDICTINIEIKQMLQSLIL